MKICSLEISNFRKFVQPMRVTGIGDGINVLVGANEFGKSTLMEAINAVVFEKARAQTQQTKSFKHFVNRTTPEVCLRFELDDKTWTLRKRFAGQSGKTLLEDSTGRKFEDEEAEAELQRLLGFGVSGRTSEPGIWGTLWVRQGESFGDPTIDDRARRTLQGCLEAQVGAVTGGSRGRKIPEAVDAALTELSSSRGPRGRYKSTTEQLVTTRQELDELESKRSQLFDSMDQLAGHKRDLSRLESDWDEDANIADIEATRKRLSEADNRAREVNAAQTRATLAHERAERGRQDLTARSVLVAEIDKLETTVKDLQRKLDGAETAHEDAKALVTEGEIALGALEAEQSRLADQDRHLHRELGIARMAEDIANLQTTANNIEADEADAQKVAEQIAGIISTPESVAAIQKAEIELTKATAALDAVATTVLFAITDDAVDRVTINGKPIESSPTTRTATDEMTVGIVSVGSISIRPQLADKRAVLGRVEAAKAALARALQDAGVADLSEAQALVVRRRDLQGKLDTLRRGIGRLAPGNPDTKLAPGLVPLKTRIAELTARRDTDVASLQLTEIPGRSDVESSLRVNASAIETERSKISAAQAGLAGPRRSLEESKEAFETLRRDVAAGIRTIELKRSELAASRTKIADDALASDAAGLEEAASHATGALTKLELAGGDTVEELNARINRLENAARGQRDQKATLDREIARLSGLISASEGDGIEERLDATQTLADRLDAEVRNFEQEVAVLELLRDTLRGAEAQAKARYLAPIVSRVEPYLKMLLPGTNLVLNEDLHIASVTRNGMDEEFTKLSKGTQEQIAVLTRLAFAELLRTQGRPATVILDDALVFSDDDRIERMFDILTRAANHTQIIILTCRQRLFTRLGAPMLRLEPIQDQ